MDLPVRIYFLTCLTIYLPRLGHSHCWLVDLKRHYVRNRRKHSSSLESQDQKLRTYCNECSRNRRCRKDNNAKDCGASFQSNNHFLCTYVNSFLRKDPQITCNFIGICTANMLSQLEAMTQAIAKTTGLHSAIKKAWILTINLGLSIGLASNGDPIRRWRK